VKGAILAQDTNSGPSPQTVGAELSRYQALAAAINRTMLFWEKPRRQPFTSAAGGAGGAGGEGDAARRKDEQEQELLVRAAGLTGPWGVAAYLQAHLQGTYDENRPDQVKHHWDARDTLVVEELACFAPVSDKPVRQTDRQTDRLVDFFWLAGWAGGWVAVCWLRPLAD
jgi:hypothetical protein